MPKVERQLVTIIVEAAVEHRLIEDVKRLGAKGYSVGRVRGEGRSANHLQDLNGPSMRLETLVTADVSQAILDHLEAEYFDRYAIVVWVNPVNVLRPDRF
jgi:nitrogen regulatory protein P-II 2